MINIIKGITNLGKKLSNLPLLFWLFIYVILIFVFALLYTYSNAKFIHNNIKYEDSFVENEIIISDRIRRQIIENTQEIYENKTIKTNNWLVDMNTFSISIIRDENFDLVFNGYFYSIDLLSQKDSETTSTFRSSMNDFEFILKRDRRSFLNDSYYFPVEIIKNELLSPGSTRTDIVDPKIFFKINDISTYAIKINPELNNLISTHLLTSSGYLTESNNRFQRMLYLSAVTITTLGYGDIVPINELARFLVALESTLGIIILGLALNSITREKRY